MAVPAGVTPPAIDKTFPTADMTSPIFIGLSRAQHAGKHKQQRNQAEKQL